MGLLIALFALVGILSPNKGRACEGHVKAKGNDVTIEEKRLMITQVRYTNWRGETADREIMPKEITFGSTQWHKEPQWLLSAMDLQKNERRDLP